MALMPLLAHLVGLRGQSVNASWIIDGGCHRGEFAAQALNHFPASHVLSFEPDPDSFQLAQRNLGSQSRSVLVNSALGARKGQAEFFRGAYTATNSLLPRPKEEAKPYYPEAASLTGGYQVDVSTIDDECAERGIDVVDLLKLDLQGGEKAALEGASEMLASQRVNVIFLEVVFVRKYHEQPLFWEIWQQMEHFGYTLYSIEDIKIGLYHQEEVSLRHRQWNQGDAIFLSPKLRAVLDG